MLKVMWDAWAKYHKDLEEVLRNIENLDAIDYEWLVKTAFETIYNKYAENSWSCDEVDINRMTVINDGHYQGTLLFLMPFGSYSPGPDDYLMTHVWYGSCSGCDTLERIRMQSKYDYEEDVYAKTPNEQQVQDLLMLCKDIITNTIKPYNYGWQHNEAFDVATVDGVKEKENA